MTTYNNVLDVFSYAAHTLANTLWSERAFKHAYKLEIQKQTEIAKSRVFRA